MKFTGQEAALCSMDGKKIKCIEGYSVDVDLSIEDININDVNSLIITGGDISSVNNEKVHNLIISLANRDVTISAICAGVDVLDGAGVLRGVKSTHSVDADIVIDKNIITAHANFYVDFAIEVAKKLDLFEDEKDLKETIDFWKYHKRVQ